MSITANDTQCQACKNQVKDWQGSDQKCGFITGLFNPDNWKCATISQIRRIADRIGRPHLPGVVMTISESEQRYSLINTESITYFHDDSIDKPLCLWVGWYKNRGSTEGMWLLFENNPPRPPTEKECLAIIEAYSQYFF